MKYKHFLVSGLLISSIWLVRSLISGTFVFYAFIIGNMILAIIPLVLEALFPLIRKKLSGVMAIIAKLFIAVLWLLFLPNAFYILTDLMYLNSGVLVNARSEGHMYAVSYSRSEGIYVLDSLFLLLATVYGAYAGGLALDHAYRFFKKHTQKKLAAFATGILMVLSAVGVYIGRYDRWNSWDGLLHPWSVLTGVWHLATSSTFRDRFLTVILSVFILEVVSVMFVQYLHRQNRSLRK